MEGFKTHRFGQAVKENCKRTGGIQRVAKSRIKGNYARSCKSVNCDKNKYRYERR